MDRKGMPGAPASKPPGPGATPSAAGSQYRPLNVKDALSYLDQVRLRFNDHQNIYNKFLDIMKDFKTQSIDTPGVIDRVSSLFRHHPTLIQGFNTFLPPGYLIEVNDNSNITVITPTGKTIRTQEGKLVSSTEKKPPADLPPSSEVFGKQEMPKKEVYVGEKISAPFPAPAASTSARPIPLTAGTLQAASFAAANEPVSTPGAAQVLNMSPEAPKGPIEFNHAINFVNKIKTRFATDPESYKTFLEILQTYQTQKKPIQEVYAAVTVLFKDAPDLLEEFKDFLPDTSAPKPPPKPVPPKKPETGTKRPSSSQMDGTWGQPPPKKKRAAPVPVNDAAKPKPPKKPRQKDEQSPEPSQAGQAIKAHWRTPPVPAQPFYPQPMFAQPLVPPQVLHPPARPHGPPSQPTLINTDELSFFDKAKKHIDDKLSYHEFLRLLNLFTLEAINMQTLLEMAFRFIGDSSDLFGAFRDLVGAPTGMVDGEHWPIDNAPALERQRFELGKLKAYGPSYRKLPYYESKALACSGRDALCWSVLNDDWACYATAASEGSHVHRKNPFEDALASSEQDRHWYNYLIETNLQAISLLEPIATRISRMSTEERTAFRLDAESISNSPSIYERIIKKIYGKDCGPEVVQALYETPAITLPIVLCRMKQKDEDWKKAQKEWNRIWRDIDSKNYYKALDHQSLTFKSNDKKTYTPKALVTEIETLYEEDKQKIVGGDGSHPPPASSQQFQLDISDRSVFFDTLKVIIAYVRRKESGFNALDKSRIEALLRVYLQLIFQVDIAEFDEHLQPLHIGDDDSDETSETKSNSADPEDSTRPLTNGAARGTSVEDLSVKLRAHAQALSDRAAAFKQRIAVKSRANTPDPADEQSHVESDGEASENPAADEPEGAATKKTHAREASMGPAVEEIEEEGHHRFYTSSHFYVLMRQFHMLYLRLLTLAHTANDLAASGDWERLNPLAVELGLAAPIINVDVGENPPTKFYQNMLDICPKFFDGEMEAMTFEENLRYMFGTQAFRIFTIDKLIAQMIKQIQVINSEPKCHDLMSLLTRQVKEPDYSAQEYRKNALELIGDEEQVFLIEWAKPNLLIRMVDT